MQKAMGGPGVDTSQYSGPVGIGPDAGAGPQVCMLYIVTWSTSINASNMFIH